MNLLIDIGHPAHIHYYRNLAAELELKGHKMSWTVKDIPVAKHLPDHYGFSYTVFPQKVFYPVNPILSCVSMPLRHITIQE